MMHLFTTTKSIKILYRSFQGKKFLKAFVSITTLIKTKIEKEHIREKLIGMFFFMKESEIKQVSLMTIDVDRQMLASNTK